MSKKYPLFKFILRMALIAFVFCCNARKIIIFEYGGNVASNNDAWNVFMNAFTCIFAGMIAYLEITRFKLSAIKEKENLTKNTEGGE